MMFTSYMRTAVAIVLLALVANNTIAQFHFNDEDGYRLWLKYDALSDTPIANTYAKKITTVNVTMPSATGTVIQQELRYALGAMLPGTLHFRDSINDNQLLIGTPASSSAIKKSLSKKDLKHVGDEGFIIRSQTVAGKNVTLIAANSDIGALYGTFHFLRLLQTHQSIARLDISESPKVDVRMLNHWDNLSRYAERGYAGQSIWNWHKLPDYLDQRYYDYARANASIGLNGVSLNNVNATPEILTPQYLEKVAALADLFRPYGIKVYLSINFSSPHIIGGLENSDPANPKVGQWWKNKANEIYQRIPNFGGFLVKANSEGEPGPGDYGRSHDMGANMLADALAPHGGIVMWRAFVYAHESGEERSKQAYSEFKPLDGKFRDNVLIQVKNGPIDFQPREPFSPLFGATPKTPMMMEFQVTQEYLGFSTHLVYLGTLYEEVLKTDTWAKGQGSTVGRVVDGSLFNNSISGMAGVSNIGADRNWTGHIMLQSNWYVFGRMAWDHELTAQAVAEEWARMTLSNDWEVVNTVTQIMMNSREIAVNYMTPLGLAHMMGTGHHYGPAPWVSELGRPEWNPVYYHRADKNGIGVNRTPTGESAIEQYHEPVRKLYSSTETIPEEFLLWFHHVPWDHTMRSGRPLWDELVHHYYQGAEDAAKMKTTWDGLEGKIDPYQFKQVQMALGIQAKEADWWRNACVLYFQTFSDMPIPEGLKAPKGTLEDYKAMRFPFAPGNTEPRRH